MSEGNFETSRITPMVKKNLASYAAYMSHVLLFISHTEVQRSIGGIEVEQFSTCGSTLVATTLDIKIKCWKTSFNVSMKFVTRYNKYLKKVNFVLKFRILFLTSLDLMMSSKGFSISREMKGLNTLISCILIIFYNTFMVL